MTDFNFLAYDKSILDDPKNKGVQKRLIKTPVSDVYKFFFIHKIINILNEINGTVDPALCFDTIRIVNFLIFKNKVSFVFSVYDDKTVGTFSIKYDWKEFESRNQVLSPSNYEICINSVNKSNKNIFPLCKERDFSINIYMNSNFKMHYYETRISTDLNTSDNDERGILIKHYHSNKETVRTIKLYSFDGDIENCKDIIDTTDRALPFECHLNSLLIKAYKFPEIFFMIYPEFSIHDVRTITNIQTFIDDLFILWKKNKIDNTFLERVLLLDMVII
jgi:hypothetical protein